MLHMNTRCILSFSLFQTLEIGKASTDDKCHFAIYWARSCQYQCVHAKVYQSIPNGLRVVGIFRELSGDSRTVGTDTCDYRAHSETQPSATLSVDFLRAVQ